MPKTKPKPNPKPTGKPPVTASTFCKFVARLLQASRDINVPDKQALFDLAKQLKD